MLLDAGADPDMRDSAGSTALLDACKCGNEPAIDLLCRRTRWEPARLHLGRGSMRTGALVITLITHIQLSLLIIAHNSVLFRTVL